MLLVTAVKRAIRGMDLSEPDKAAVELALAYARAIDAQGPVDVLGPKLLTALEALCMTPRARATLVKGGSRERPASPLDELRKRRAARQHRTEDLDTPAAGTDA